MGKAMHTPTGAAAQGAIKCDRGFFDYTYLGTKAALIAAGVVPDGVAFHGERPSTVPKGTPYTFTNHAGERCKILRGGPGVFIVRVPMTGAQILEAAAERDATAKAKAESQKAAAEARVELANLEAETPARWRENKASMLQRLGEVVLVEAETTGGTGYKLGAADLSAVRQALAEAADRIRAAQVHIDRAARAERRRELLSRCAAADEGLQAFLAGQMALLGTHDY